MGCSQDSRSTRNAENLDDDLFGSLGVGIGQKKPPLTMMRRPDVRPFAVEGYITLSAFFDIWLNAGWH